MKQRSCLVTPGCQHDRISVTTLHRLVLVQSPRYNTDLKVHCPSKMRFAIIALLYLGTVAATTRQVSSGQLSTSRKSSSHVSTSHLSSGRLPMGESSMSPLSTTTTVVCATYFGDKSLKAIPRSTTTRKSTFTVTRALIVVPVTTRTPKPVTQTSLVDITTSTTNTISADTTTITKTNTFAATSTITSTSTMLSTSTERPVKTVPYPDYTTTISTSSGFLPIRSDPANLPLRKRAQPIQKRGCVTPLHASGYGYEYEPERYPTSVGCDKLIKIYTSKIKTTTARGTTITAVAPTPTLIATSTRNHTFTATEIPVLVMTTITENSTTTQLSTIVVRKTSTTTTQIVSTSTAAPIATAYTGCGPDNFISSHNNQHIVGFSRPSDDLMTINTMTNSTYTEQTCCQA
jgi:hypothetical protein